MSFDPEAKSHRRYNPLSGEWVLVSPHRNLRPWQGQTETVPSERRRDHEPDCYLCPGSRRAGGTANPKYTGTFVFDNDFPALVPGNPGAPAGLGDRDRLLHSEPVSGVCRVICFSPRHDLTLAQLGPAGIGGVIETWAEQTADLGRSYRWVQVFENKGSMMGCSNAHPHGQIWASSSVPTDVVAEDRHQREYTDVHGSLLLGDYARRELDLSSRVVCQNEEFVAVVPFWAIWPFETLLLPRGRVRRMSEMDGRQREGLTRLLDVLLNAYDDLFGVSLPYCMGWHGAPFDGEPQDHWQLHGHVYPPLLRSASIRKFMVGYEMLAEPQRDLTAEQAAERLRTHVRSRSG